MASRYKIGATSESMDALDALTTPVPDPQSEYRKYADKVKLGDGTYFGRGSSRVIWEFAMLDMDEQAQIITSLASAVYIQSPDVDDVDTVYQVTPNLPDPRESGSHKAFFPGYRTGLMVEFIILAVIP